MGKVVVTSISVDKNRSIPLFKRIIHGSFNVVGLSFLFDKKGRGEEFVMVKAEVGSKRSIPLNMVFEDISQIPNRETVNENFRFLLGDKIISQKK